MPINWPKNQNILKRPVNLKAKAVANLQQEAARYSLSITKSRQELSDHSWQPLPTLCSTVFLENGTNIVNTEQLELINDWLWLYCRQAAICHSVLHDVSALPISTQEPNRTAKFIILATTALGVFLWKNYSIKRRKHLQILFYLYKIRAQ